MTATESFRSVVREVAGPALRVEGFKGSGTTWVLTSQASDRAVVNIQSSSSSSRAEVLFVVNLAVIPEPWWAWQHRGRPEPKSPKGYHGLWRERLHPLTGGHLRGSKTWWSVRDSETARAAGEDVVGQLLNDALPRLRRLLNRSEMLRAIREGELGHARGESNRTFFDVALTVMLADGGENHELQQVLQRLSNSDNEAGRRAFESLRPWLAERWSARKPDRPTGVV